MATDSTLRIANNNKYPFIHISTYIYIYKCFRSLAQLGAKVFDMRLHDLDPDVGQTGQPTPHPSSDSFPSFFWSNETDRGQSFTAVAVIKMLPNFSHFIYIFLMLSVLLSEVLCRIQQIRTHFKNVDTQHRAIKFIFHSFSPPMSLSLFLSCHARSYASLSFLRPFFMHVNCEWTQLAALLKLSDRLRCKFERFFHAHYAIHILIGKKIHLNSLSLY